MKYISEFAAVTMAGLGLALPAHGTPVAWSSSANGCVATPGTLSANRMSTGAYVTHLGANVDPITLVCPVTTLGGVSSIGWNLSLTYLDSTGMDTGASVKATLYKQSRTTGVTSAIRTVSSDGSAATTVNLRSVTFVPGFDFDANVYYVQIVLDRSMTSQSVRAYSVALEATMV